MSKQRGSFLSTVALWFQPCVLPQSQTSEVEGPLVVIWPEACAVLESRLQHCKENLQSLHTFQDKELTPP